MKDLTFIAEGNPDYLKGGLINLTKRRQVNLLLNFDYSLQKRQGLDAWIFQLTFLTV